LHTARQQADEQKQGYKRKFFHNATIPEQAYRKSGLGSLKTDFAFGRLRLRLDIYLSSKIHV
jgi:hypothetical protein